MGLLPGGETHVRARELTLKGRSLMDLSEARYAAIRGDIISMIFQDPMNSLNPSLTVGYQIAEAIRLHKRVSGRKARKMVLEMLQRVGIPDASRRLTEYPHQLSGGMRQRVMIAMALVCRPKVLIADEPTTALDVTVQAQILDLIDRLRRDFDTAVLFITHDLGVVAEIADEVAVIYAGRIVEQGSVTEIFDHPSHGYTVGLLGSLSTAAGADGRLVEISGNPPRLDRPEYGCAFAPRCVFAEEACRTVEPVMEEIATGHYTRCRRHEAVTEAWRQGVKSAANE
jgi:oligopeptide/dipeptide ABC transporter ATP-binding protein